jgi:signal transduction histidine kinase
MRPGPSPSRRAGAATLDLSLMRTLLWTIGGIWTAALAASLSALAIQQDIWAMAAALAVASLVSLVVAVRHRAQTARLRALARDARRIAAVTSAQTSEPLRPAPLEGPTDSDELDELHGAIAALGARVGAQLREVAKKSRNLEVLVDAVAEPVLATGEGDRVIFCNRAAELLLQAPPGGLIGRAITELFTRRELLELHAGARAGQPRRGEAPLTTAAGVRTFAISATPLPAAWGEGVYGAVLVLRDVTELAQAVQAQRDFVANASHELRTPVAALRIAIETLAEGAKDDPPMRDRLLGVCAAHVHRLEEMIRDLMDLSRLEQTQLPVRREPVSMADLEESLRLVFEPICSQRRLRLQFDFDPRLEGLWTDPRLLQLVLRNLIDNATKFAFEDSVIRIRGLLTGERPERLPPPTPSGAGHADGPSHAAGEGPDDRPADPPPDAVARFQVIDRGVGIPLAQQERVFERFYQVDPARTGSGASSRGSRRGSGLGLAIVKHAATAMGGRVGINSVWGEGTSVWVDLPVTLEPPAPTPGSPAPATAQAIKPTPPTPSTPTTTASAPSPHGKPPSPA